MKTISSERTSAITLAIGTVIACLMVASTWMIFFVAPTEATMGDVQRIVYLHVSVAWCGLAGCLAMGFCGAIYLVRRRLEWDFWSRAAGEVGWLCTTLTLITGSAWAHEAWGTWWTWEPRLTSSLVLWIIYAGSFPGAVQHHGPASSGTDWRRLGRGRHERRAACADGHPLVSRRPSGDARNGPAHEIRVAGLGDQLHGIVRFLGRAAASST